MKKLLCCFVFLTCLSVFGQEDYKLPEEPWEDIVDMKLNDNGAIKKWNRNVKVGLEGDFTQNDTIQISKFIKKLDSITETVSIGISDYEDSNLQIKLSSINTGSSARYNYSSESRYENNSVIRNLAEANILLHRSNKNDTIALNYLKVTLARVLFIGCYSHVYKDSGFNIFNTYDYGHQDEVKKARLTANDLKIVEEIYKIGFEEKLVIAEEIYKEKVEKRLNDYKISRRDKNLWWVKNPIAIILLPTLVLFLFFLLIIKKVKNFIDFKLKNALLKFTLVSIVIVLFTDVIIIFCYSLYEYLVTPIRFGYPFFRFETFATTGMVTLVFFPFLYLFRYIEVKLRKGSNSIVYKTVLIFLSTGFLPFFLVLIFELQRSDKPFTRNEVNLVMSRFFLFLMSIATLRALVSFFTFKEHKLIIENERQLSQLRELKTKAELKSLQSQINPHFLYNSLNSIASLAPIDAGKTQQMAYSLSDLFKYSINRKGKKMSTVQEEITMVNSYLEIEKIRFGDRLQFSIQVDDSLLEKEIPLFLIQPLVENAVKHGISKNKDQGEILLKIEMKDENLLISVYDNGPKFLEGLVSGHGLQTVYDLLRLSYQDNAFVNWTNEPKKMIQISIPQNL